MILHIFAEQEFQEELVKNFKKARKKVLSTRSKQL